MVALAVAPAARPRDTYVRKRDSRFAAVCFLFEPAAVLMLKRSTHVIPAEMFGDGSADAAPR